MITIDDRRIVISLDEELFQTYGTHLLAVTLQSFEETDRQAAAGSFELESLTLE